MTTHVYRRIAKGDGTAAWGVGYDATVIGQPGGFTWVGPEFPLEEDAAVYAAFLNGGQALGPYAHRYISGALRLLDNTMTELLTGGNVNYPVLCLSSCQIANRLTNKDAIMAFHDGNNASKIIGFLGCNQADSHEFNFNPGILATAGNSIYCSSIDAVADLYVAAQGIRLRATPPP